MRILGRVPGPDLSGAVLDGRYQVIEPIAEGAMGAVYRGERLKLGRAVAIKIMHDALPDELASRQRFEREAKLMARLEHPHCVSVIDFGLHDDKPYLVMELVRGTSLQRASLDEVTRFEPPRAVELVRQVLSGLAPRARARHRPSRHQAGEHHAVTEKTGLGEHVRILDFGLARPATEHDQADDRHRRRHAELHGARADRGGDDRRAHRSLRVGVLLFEMLTGKKPFLADDPIEVVRKHLNDAAADARRRAPPGSTSASSRRSSRARSRSRPPSAIRARSSLRRPSI